MRHAGGLDTPVEMDLIRVGVDDQLLVMVQLRDITDRKRLERQLHTYREELEDKVTGAHQRNRRDQTISGESARERQRRHLHTRYRAAVYLCQQ